MLDMATKEQLDRIEGMLSELLGKEHRQPRPMQLRDDLRRKAALDRHQANKLRRELRQ